MKRLLRVSYCVPFIAVTAVLLGCDSQSHMGQQVFKEQCSSCHNADTSDRKMGPALKGLFNNETLVSNGQEVTEATVRAKIGEGGRGMPAFQKTLSDEDITYVLAYLRTL